MKTGKTLQELAMEIERQNREKRDFIADTRSLRLVPQDNIYLDMATNKSEGLNITRMEVNDIAHRQIAQNLGIPATYYNKMRNDYPELLAANVNGWFMRNPQRRMIRTLDGRVRAYLSDKYRRIDNYEVAQAVLPIIGEMNGARVESCELTDSRMYLKVVNPRLQAEVKPGDVVQAGIMITNSETGQGAVSVYPLVYRLVCTNGMIAADSGQRKYHIGRRIEDTDEAYELFRDETIAADDRAFLMKLQDIVRVAVDQAKFAAIVDKMRQAADAKINTINIPAVVELAAKEYGLTKDEGGGVLQYLIQGGDLSLYGLANSVTRLSQDVDDYDRATELEAVGWDVLNMDRGTWNRINNV